MTNKETNIKKFISDLFFIEEDKIQISITKIGCTEVLSEFSINGIGSTLLSGALVELVWQHSLNILNERK